MRLARAGDEAALRRVLDVARPPSPDPPAAVQAGGCPPGFTTITRRVRVGSGRDALRRFGEVVTNWDMHRRSGLAVLSPRGRATIGCDVALGAKFGPVMAVMACRVDEVYHDDRRVGFS